VIVSGTLRVPGDKSLSHRALILGALADGGSSVRGLLDAQDVRSTATALRTLGASIEWTNGDARLRGGGRRGLAAPRADLDCGNSGTSARLLAGVVAGHAFQARFVGDDSLSRRPMQRIKQPLEAMGATVELERGEGLPMVVRGGDLRPIVWTTTVASAQTKSAILLAALVANVRAEIHEPAASRDHTERLLHAMGADIRDDSGVVILQPSGSLAPLDLEIPGDPSSAAFPVALGLIAGAGEVTVHDVGLNERRRGFFEVVRRMGGDISWTVEREVAGEPVGTIRAKASELQGTTIEGSNVPAMIDELVLLACVATRARGDTIVRGAQELRVKESDRIATVVRNLRAIGAEAEETPDGFVVRGSPARLAGQVEARGDHRVAMAFGVLGALPENDIAIDDMRCVAVSYPAFWTDLASLTR
jgi:3-phosphoshikimate 1-carboxyvinyltransferase